MRLTSRLQKLEARRRRGSYIYLWDSGDGGYTGAGGVSYTADDLQRLPDNVQAIVFTWRGASDIPGARVVRMEDDAATVAVNLSPMGDILPSATATDDGTSEKLPDPTPYEPPYMGRGVATSHPRPRFRAR